MPDARAVPTPRSTIAILLCLCLAACSGDDADRHGGEAPVEVVTTATVARQPWHDRIRALGTVKAHESVEVTAKVSETVEQVHFDSGDEVAQGAPLVTLSGQQQRSHVADPALRVDDGGRR